jgi:glycosyltransferase involved in cell wall biosynthesis
MGTPQIALRRPCHQPGRDTHYKLTGEQQEALKTSRRPDDLRLFAGSKSGSSTDTPTMRVLRIVGGLDPGFGGPSESAVNQCIATQAAGVENTFIYPFHPSISAKNDSALTSLHSAGVVTRSFRISRVAGRHSHRWALSAGLSAWTLRELRRYDLVHVHSAWGAAQLVALQAASHTGRPCIMTPHESLTRFDIENSGSVPPKLKYVLRRRYLAKLSLVVFSSSLEMRDSMLEGARARAVVIPHPVTGILPEEAVLHREARETPVIGFLGRLHPKKNVEFLIEAVARVPAIRLVIAGDGPSEYRRALAELVDDRQMREQVEWLGFVRGRDRDRFLDSVDVLAMPSAYECFGMAAAEAMARGVPPMVSSECGIGDIVTRHACGFVVRPELEKWVAALSKLAGDHTLEDLRRRSVEAARRELSMEAFGGALRGEYERLANDLA